MIKIFYSYCHKDEGLKESLETHLAILKRKNLIDDWSDREIIAGQEWDNEINQELECADIILLLISSDFIASEYCYANEMSKSVEKHEKNQATVIPIILRPCEWADTPFSKLQALPKNAAPITTWENEDTAWLNVVEGLKKAIHEIKERAKRKHTSIGLKSINSILSDEIERIDDSYQKDFGTCTGIPTGFQDLDIATDGLHKNEVILVASRPSMGRTDFLLHIALNVSITRNKPSAYFSTTTSSKELIRRSFASLGQIKTNKLLKGWLDDNDWPQLTSAVSILKDTPIYINDNPSISYEELANQIETSIKEQNLSLVVIDSLHDITDIINSKNTQKDVKKISTNLKELARKHGITIIAGSTLFSQNIENRAERRPFTSDLQELSPFEEDANLMLFLYRDEVYNADTIDKGIIEVIIGKNRNGSVGKLRLSYIEEQNHMRDLARAIDETDDF